MSRRRRFTEEEKRIVRELYPLGDVPAQELADRLGRSVQSIYTLAQHLHLTKDASYRTRSGKKAQQNASVQRCRFQPGHIPANKGKLMSPEVRAKCQHTFFKKGGVPPNRKPVGSERIDVDGYYKVKVAEPNVWVHKQRVVWEQHHGPIPPGMCVAFKDGNRRNTSIDNLVLTSKRQRMINNQLANLYPPEVVEVARLRGTLKRKINQITKKENE